MVLCIHIQTHRAPDQVARLVRLLCDTADHAVVTVSHDRSGPALDRDALESMGDVHVIEVDGGYGDWSHLSRYLDALDVLEARGVEYDWVTNITGQDFPLRPMRAIEDELAAADVDAYAEFFDVLSSESPWGVRRGRSRYWYRYAHLCDLGAAAERRLRPLHALNLVQPLVRCNVNRGLRVGRRVRVPFDDTFRCYGGSLYTTLDRATAEKVRRAAVDRPQLVDHYRGTLSPSESFFQTVLCNDDTVRVENDCRRFFDFGSGGNQHPRVLGPGDVAPALASGCDFARKWDHERDPEALERLEAHVREAGRGR